jgi:hypothetical protein
MAVVFLGQASLFPPDRELPLRKRVEVVRPRAGQARYILQKYHYLHRARTGRQLNYEVRIDGVTDGVITYAYPMMSASLCDVSSDELVEFARLYLHSNIPHTASCAVGKSLRVIEKDWSGAFPTAKPLKLVVSWSDTEYHQGTIYKAANFDWLRRSKGKPPGNTGTSVRGAREKHGDYSHEKDCWVYWLDGKLKKAWGEKGVAIG